MTELEEFEVNMVDSIRAAPDGQVSKAVRKLFHDFDTKTSNRSDFRSLMLRVAGMDRPDVSPFVKVVCEGLSRRH